RLIFFAAAQRTQAQHLGVGLRQHYPFAASSRDKSARVKLNGWAVHFQSLLPRPNRSALAANTAGHDSGSLENRTTMYPRSSRHLSISAFRARALSLS